MTARPFVADGLWRALCPSYNPRLVHRCIEGSRPPRASRSIATATTTACQAQTQKLRSRDLVTSRVRSNLRQLATAAAATTAASSREARDAQQGQQQESGQVLGPVHTEKNDRQGQTSPPRIWGSLRRKDQHHDKSSEATLKTRWAKSRQVDGESRSFYIPGLGKWDQGGDARHTGELSHQTHSPTTGRRTSQKQFIQEDNYRLDGDILDSPQSSGTNAQPHSSSASFRHNNPEPEEDTDQADYEPDVNKHSQNHRSVLTLEETDFVHQATRDVLYHGMSQAAQRGHLALVEAIALRLVHHLHETPSLAIYHDLILANTSQTLGSAALARALVQELKAEGLTPGANIYEAIFKVLAVHPDVVYRGQILDEMRQKWISPSPASQHFIASGHIRELAVEQALEVLDSMLANNIEPEPWLLNMAMSQLCAMGEVDEAFRLLKLRVDSDSMRESISAGMWVTVLDAAASALHHPALAYIWRRRVEQLKYTPTTGQCTQVLHAAARQGDVALASDVFRTLSMRGTMFDKMHYELLLDCYVRAKDIDNALHILCIMQSAGAKPDARSMRPLARAFGEDSGLVDAAFDALKELRDQGRDIPLVAVNVMIEATLDGGKDDAASERGAAEGRLDAAVERYKSLRFLCPEGPNVATFDTLLKACRKARRRDTAMFLVAEMVACGVRPGALTYDRLVLVCLETADLGENKGIKDALLYYDEMIAAGFAARRGTLRLLADACTAAGDADRGEALAEEIRAAGRSF